jgi:hypothetical protein
MSAFVVFKYSRGSDPAHFSHQPRRGPHPSLLSHPSLLLPFLIVVPSLSFRYHYFCDLGPKMREANSSYEQLVPFQCPHIPNGTLINKTSVLSDTSAPTHPITCPRRWVARRRPLSFIHITHTSRSPYLFWVPFIFAARRIVTKPHDFTVAAIIDIRTVFVSFILPYS